MTNRDLDAALDRLAPRQSGAFSRRQVLDRGGSRREINTRLAGRRWHSPDHEVYALASYPDTWDQRVWASVLGEVDAMASGTTAAVLHRFTGFARTRPEIQVPTHAHHVSRVARVRRSGLADLVYCDGIPTNSAALTLFELAGRYPQMIDGAVDSALHSGATTMAELIGWYEQLEHSRRPGLKLMRRVLEKRSAIGYVPPESELERLLYETLDIPEFQPFVRQAPAPWNPDHERVDGLIVRARIIVEADSWAHHEGFEAARRDERRDHLAEVHGYHCARLYYDELKHDRAGVRARMRALVKARTTPPETLGA